MIHGRYRGGMDNELTPEQAAALSPDDPNIAANPCDDDPESLVGEELGDDDETVAAVNSATAQDVA